MADDKRRIGFESLMLSGVWLLILLAFGKRPAKKAAYWRANAIEYFDEHGRPGDEPKKYRREETFPELML